MRLYIVRLVLIAIVATSASCALAGDTADFTGKYIAEPSKKAPSSGSTLEVVQKEDAIEITLLMSEKRTVSRCPLDGSEGDYTSPGGIAGKCKARIKGRNVVVESVVVVTNSRVRTKERWQLSQDGKTLAIKLEHDFPDAPPEVSAALSDDTSMTTKYKRVENK